MNHTLKKKILWKTSPHPEHKVTLDDYEACTGLQIGIATANPNSVQLLTDLTQFLQHRPSEQRGMTGINTIDFDLCCSNKMSAFNQNL